MGFLDKMMGSRPAKAGVEPLPTSELRDLLLGLTRETAPWQVRDGTDDGCDLLAEFKIVDARWQGIFLAYGLEKTFRVKLKFHEDSHEVRNVDESATIEWREGIPAVSTSWSRGQINEIDKGRGVGFTEQGEFGEVYNYTFRSNEIKDPLRDAVTEHGWAWKAVSFRL